MARRSDKNLIVGLDIGTSKIACLVGEVKADDRIEIIGLGTHPSRGLKKGVVVDIEIKTMPDRPELTAAPERMVDAVLDVAAALGMQRQVALRSFDWRALAHAARVAPAIPRGYITSADTSSIRPRWRIDQRSERS